MTGPSSPCGVCGIGFNSLPNLIRMSDLLPVVHEAADDRIRGSGDIANDPTYDQWTFSQKIATRSNTRPPPAPNDVS